MTYILTYIWHEHNMWYTDFEKSKKDICNHHLKKSYLCFIFLKNATIV